MLVCRVAPLVEHCYTCLWLLSALYWLVVNSGEVLPEFFSIGSGGSEVSPELCGARFWLLLRCPLERFAVVLVRVSLRTVPCSFLSIAVLPQGLRCAVYLAGAFWWVCPERCLGGSGGGSSRTCLRCFCSSACCSVSLCWSVLLVVWVVRAGEGSSQDRPFVDSGRGSSQECSVFILGYRCVASVV
ncbi:hypothetical protein Taro_035135 [Colocasia esculenta]|uniref:Uncharacterized protein n=1 Tax=Colocasia esculenta TaxID=4460 RepID=A0A843VZM4_COLES|nr:hypothetical protein [Colocasia esculenta]